MGIAKLSRVTFVGVVLAIFAGAQARAGVIVIGTVNSTSPIAFSEVGPFLDAGNFDGPTDTRGTNVFLAKTLPVPGGSSPQTVSTTNGLTVVMSAVSDGLNQTDLGSGTDNVYLTEFYTPDQSGAYLTISGLNPLDTYQIQFPHGENRAIPYIATQSFKDSNGMIATSLLHFGDGTLPNYALITVDVSGSTSLEYFMPHSDNVPGYFRGPSFDGYTIRTLSDGFAAVPVPRAFIGGLALLGALGLLKLQRKVTATA